jgi:hypothetical protein
MFTLQFSASETSRSDWLLYGQLKGAGGVAQLTINLATQWQSNAYMSLLC